MARNLRCQICSTFYSLTVALMLSHLLKVHRNDPDFFVKCDIPGCQRTFKNVHTYKSHLSRHHKGVNIRQPVRFFEGSATGPTVEGMDFEMEDALPEDHYNDSEMPAEENLYDGLEDRLEANKTLNAFYLLRSKEAQSPTQKALDDVVEGSTSLVRNTVELIKLGVQNRLDSAGIDFKAVPGLSELFAEDHQISNPFAHVSTKNKQAAYYAEKFGLVVRIFNVILEVALHYQRFSEKTGTSILSMTTINNINKFVVLP